MMRPNIHTYGWLNCLFICLVATAAINPLTAQDSPLRVYMYLDYFKTDDSQYLQAELKYREDGGFKQLKGVEVVFTMTADTSIIDLGKKTTTADGLARLDLSEVAIVADTLGITQYEASFEGNESYKSSSKDIEVGVVNISMQTEEVDSIRRLNIMATKQVGGNSLVVEDLDIKIGIERLFGLLTLSEVSTDEDGLVQFDFPIDLPGDALGNINVIAMTDDDDDFGTVKTRTKVGWGKPVYYHANEAPRTLWSRDAPLWIIITVLFLFLVVWYHYFLAVNHLIKIRKL